MLETELQKLALQTETVMCLLCAIELRYSSMSSSWRRRRIGAMSHSKETLDLLMDIFLQNNCLEHVFQVMSYHPTYLECFMRIQQYLMYGDGPLPFSYRHYIAIMAAARHHCSYLVNIHSTEFLLQHGDEQWLKGVQHAPAKLQRLSEVNRILAHRPWLITTDHIQRLVQGSEDCQENWSMSELMHAIVLLAHFHALASFVYGCGVTSEVDHPDGHVYTAMTDEHSGSEEDDTAVNGHNAVNAELDSGACDVDIGGTCGIDSLLQTMRHIIEMASDEITEDEMTQRFEKVENQNADLLMLGSSDDITAVFGDSISRFVEDSDFTYEDFCRRGEKSTIPTFRASDFSWDDYGFSLGNGLYTDIGSLLDDKFTVAQNLTYNTMGDKSNVDTTSFRRAIWNYIHSLFGIRHDDYDYSVINKLLERPLKAYVKIATCFPERVTRADYDAFMRDFNHSEKVHVNVMVLEAKLQAEVLYSFRAINKFMTYR